MAIVIEEEKKGGRGWFGFGVLFVVLAVLGASAYYLFFVQPELISSVVPLKNQIDEIAKIKFDPQTVVSGKFYQGLKQVVPQISPRPAGNATPFGVF